MKREDLENLKLEAEAIADVYENHLNTGIDFGDSVDISEDGSFAIYYFYDGEASHQEFSSLKYFCEKVEKYGKNFEEDAI